MKTVSTPGACTHDISPHCSAFSHRDRSASPDLSIAPRTCCSLRATSVTFLIVAAPPASFAACPHQSGLTSSLICCPLTHSTKRYGPVPTGLLPYWSGVSLMSFIEGIGEKYSRAGRIGSGAAVTTSSVYSSTGLALISGPMNARISNAFVLSQV